MSDKPDKRKVFLERERERGHVRIGVTVPRGKENQVRAYAAGLFAAGNSAPSLPSRRKLARLASHSEPAVSDP
jgi:hypothetical protein